MKFIQALELLAAVVLVVSAEGTYGDSTQEDSHVEGLIVELPNGKLRGKFNGLYYSYESIPYATPPLGELRFESPRPYTAQWDGVRDGTVKPAPCMQWNQFVDGDNKLTGVEDCLMLNVYRPKRALGPLPVLVMIHGGAFMFGSGEDNQADILMEHSHFVVVKMNYRLGPLGFLSTEDAVIPGNYGLKDQRMALQWIKANIARFGGDPERMIVSGFSAGGASVHIHMMQKNFTNYAKAAVSFSGTALSPWVVLRNSRARAFAMARNLKCPSVGNSAEIKRCLKGKSAAEIVSDVRNFLVFGYNPFTTFGPVVEPPEVEDAMLTQRPEDVIASGDFVKVPWLVSYSAQDGGYNAAELMKIAPRRGELIEALNERWFDLAPYALFFKDSFSSVEELDDYSMALKSHYLGDKEFSAETYRDVQRMYTDVLFKNGAEKAVRLHRQVAKSPVYAYVYDNPADLGVAAAISKRKDIKFGTTHGDDFFLIFGTPVRPILRDDEKKISQKFITMLENFVDNDELAFGNCKFRNNVNEEDLQIMKITKDNCENLSVHAFP